MSNETSEKSISSELVRAEAELSKIEKTYQVLHKAGYLTKFQKESIYNRMMTILIFVGELGNSTDMNEVRLRCEEKSRKDFPNSEKKARTAFLKSYEAQSAPYDKLKERCWRIIDKVNSK